MIERGNRSNHNSAVMYFSAVNGGRQDGALFLFASSFTSKNGLPALRGRLGVREHSLVSNRLGRRFCQVAASKDVGEEPGQVGKRQSSAERESDSLSQHEKASTTGAKASGAETGRKSAVPANHASRGSASEGNPASAKMPGKERPVTSGAPPKAARGWPQLAERLVSTADAIGKPVAALGARARVQADEALVRLLQGKDSQQETKRRAAGAVKAVADRTWAWWRNQVIPVWIRPRLPASLASRSDETIAAGLHALFFVLFFALPGLFHGPSGSEQKALSERRQLESQTTRLERRLREGPSDAGADSQKAQQKTDLIPKTPMPKAAPPAGGRVPAELSAEDRRMAQKAPAPADEASKKATTPPAKALSNVLVQLRDTLPPNQREWIVAASYDSLSAEPLIAVEVRPSAFFTASPSDQEAFALRLLEGARQLGVNAVRLADGEGNVLATAGGRTVALVGTERRLATEIQALRKELERAAAETATARSETAAAREELAVAKDMYAKERAETERTMQAIKADNERLSGDLKDALQELEQQPERETLLARAERAEEERKKYALSVESLGEQVAEARNAQQKAEKEAAMARAQAKEAEERIQAVNAAKESALETQRREFEAQIQAEKSERERAVAAARQEADTQMKKLEDALAAAEQSKAQAVAQARSESNAEIERLTKQLEMAAKEQEKAVEAARQEARQTIQGLQNKLEQGATEQQRQLAQLDQQYQDRIRALESQVAKATSDRNAAIQEAVAKIEKENAQLAQAKERELATSRAELAAAKSEAAKQLSHVQQENARRVASLEKQIAAERKTAERLQARIQKLEQRLGNRSVPAPPPAPADADSPPVTTSPSKT
jgi:hypothetical protein